MRADGMEEGADSASFLAEPADNCTSMTDTSTLLAVEASGADEQIGENIVGTLRKKARGFWKIAWIGGALFVGTVVGALEFEWSSSARSPAPHSVTQLQALDTEESAFLKSVRSGLYLHVPANPTNNLDVSANPTKNSGPVLQMHSTSDGSRWQVEHVGNSSSMIMLKSVQSGGYLHVSSESDRNGGPVFHVDSTSDGSLWQVEHVGSSGQIIMLKSVRSGFYLHVSSVADEPVFHTDSASDGSKWLLQEVR